MALSQVTILGATGSIGSSTLDVLSRHPGKYNVFALTANSNVVSLLDLCLRFRPTFAVMRDKTAAEALAAELARHRCETSVLAGEEGLRHVASCPETDIVMAAIVGAAGLTSSLAAAKAGKRLLLANKEALVMSGALFMETVAASGAKLLPIDSEHNAIFQCLANGADGHARGVSKILLTGSGGPLRTLPMDQLSAVTPDQACAHPNWDMGRKISVDSATMMNKGLELIEARWLFDTSPDNIEIVIHPESTIHSMVQYVDGSVLAQLGNPDMRTPIAHGLAWPERIESGVDALDLMAHGQLTFDTLDRNRFPCVALAEAAADGAGSLSIGLNAANEMAVDSFLHELIRFTDIPLVIEAVMNQTEALETHTIEHILAVDNEARQKAREHIQKLAKTR